MPRPPYEALTRTKRPRACQHAALSTWVAVVDEKGMSYFNLTPAAAEDLAVELIRIAEHVRSNQD